VAVCTWEVCRIRVPFERDYRCDSAPRRHASSRPIIRKPFASADRASTAVKQAFTVNLLRSIEKLDLENEGL
jgi:hypothetical protein